MEQDQLNKALHTAGNYMRLTDWADTFGFELEAGRMGEIGYVKVDGVLIAAEDVDAALGLAAHVMGMSDKRLHGTEEDAPFLRLR